MDQPQYPDFESSPDAIGEIQQRSTVSATVRQTINHSSYLLLAGDFNRQSSLDGLNYGTADLWRASVSYGYRLTQEWNAQLAYKFSERVDDNGPAHSNAVLLSATRNVTILP